MMLTFFLLILLGFPSVGTIVNSSHGLNISSRKIEATIPPNETLHCHFCTNKNSFKCPQQKTCEKDQRFCLTIATRMSSREFLVFKHCILNCPFLQSPAPMIIRRLASTNSFYYTNCCTGIFCNDGGPANIERDLLPPHVVEEVEVARAVCLEEFNLLLSLALILSSSILT